MNVHPIYFIKLHCQFPVKVKDLKSQPELINKLYFTNVLTSAEEVLSYTVNQYSSFCNFNTIKVNLIYTYMNQL